MKKEREIKILSVAQSVKYEKTIAGIIFLIGGLLLSCKKFEMNAVLLSIYMVVMCLEVAFSLARGRLYKEEKFDEMAMENLNKASRKVLNAELIFCACFFSFDIISDALKYLFSFEIQWNNYFIVTPFSVVLLILGFQFFMTGFYFKRLERE